MHIFGSPVLLEQSQAGESILLKKLKIFKKN